ncbi:hypothetical protein DES38_1025 [Streptohalobacillus salinus]|uniref:Uncharacterized protein n=1 Tax=Streptohalobacillus salinus TaxID=621096 RepID=A0A2V3WG66_9BACI|nr:hypothetical protein [Streptohalobacillus salinus]PXW92427.1 hypothetical protein DES38_1025 [Streptohalobacillus salinus]
MKKKKWLSFFYVMIILLTGLSLFLSINTIQPERNQPDRTNKQYYGEIVSITKEGVTKKIKVKAAQSPYPDLDKAFEGEVTLIAFEDINLSARIGPNKESFNLELGQLQTMYESLTSGNFIAFTFNDLVFESEKTISEIIFTGGYY